MASCVNCTGSRWLGDNESLGRCVCVTPEAMRVLDETVRIKNAALNDAHEGWKMAEGVARLSEAEQDAALDTLLDKEVISFTAAVVRQGWAIDRDEVRDRLEAYLVSAGLPAVPTGALDNPALEELVSFVMT